jgi:hypothetical protein
MGGTSCGPVCLAALGRRRLEDAFEYTQAVHVDETAMQRLMRPAGLRRGPPAQTSQDRRDNTPEQAAIINPGNATRHLEIRLNPPHLRLE